LKFHDVPIHKVPKLPELLTETDERLYIQVSMLTAKFGYELMDGTRKNHMLFEVFNRADAFAGRFALLRVRLNSPP